ncbi:hypothetical protein GCM10010166_15110 [Couchioplanes caeruleus subsp. azureus]|nr:hypothetical protein GCM10010166_15110 [Couchioplanes caeruleus subsp. azureus]
MSNPPVGVRDGAHPQVTLRCQLPDASGGRAGRIEQLLRTVRPEPALQQRQVFRVVADAGQRHLVRAPRAGDLDPVDLLGPGPALGRAQHDQRPDGTAAGPLPRPGRRLNLADPAPRL